MFATSKPSALLAALLVADGAERYSPDLTSAEVAMYARRSPATSTGTAKPAIFSAAKQKMLAPMKLSFFASRKRPVDVTSPGLKAATSMPPHRLLASLQKSTFISLESWYAFAPLYAPPSAIAAPAARPDRSPSVAPVAGSFCTSPPGDSGSCTPDAVITRRALFAASCGCARLASRKCAR